MKQSYSGLVKAIIFDWAGTTVDHGSLAPVRVLQQLFAKRGVPISEAQARRDMGVLKKDHIRKILFEPSVAAKWRDAVGHTPTEADVESLFANFVPLQLECLVKYSVVIDGVAETVARLRKRGIKIGSTTGYTRAMLDMVLQPAAAQGYQPDCAITPDDVGAGRPHPWMIFANAIHLKVEPLEAIVKVGDTPVDIEEGLRAGVWTIGVARTGNMVGLSAEDFSALAPAQQASRLESARTLLAAAGAHEVIDAVANCERALDAIEARIRHGERP
ncbi:MAG TPA: phosphonoacetaldehyde hydrolase [Candidatus Binatus sp.]|uniref:phosphonoacetaldehyde hydrolase n=1 Tax=Candidatus Binatus sp. TaxID=2811406 RepID=UPI002B4837DE|nr:phosphonoacetaldehyde hydrolase [Candidatus Binatus sp.]HKN14206.1 phosphonoacetaldehyde hydrolase [Candidatus Binatus sp.]